MLLYPFFVLMVMVRTLLRQLRRSRQIERSITNTHFADSLHSRNISVTEKTILYYDTYNITKKNPEVILNVYRKGEITGP